MNIEEELGYRLECMFDEYLMKVQNNQSSRKPRFTAIINSYKTPKKTKKELLAIFSKNREEIRCAIEGTDPQCAEGWSFLTITKLKKIEEYLTMLVDVLEETSKITRRKKVIDPAKLVKDLKFSSENKKLKIKSVNPIDIIGCKHCVLYHPKTNKIVYLESKDGMTVKGTTIKNFDDTSFMKSLRNNKAVLNQVLIGPSLSCKNTILKINCKELSPMGRTNDQTIILRVGK